MINSREHLNACFALLGIPALHMGRTSQQFVQVAHIDLWRRV